MHIKSVTCHIGNERFQPGYLVIFKQHYVCIQTIGIHVYILLFMDYVINNYKLFLSYFKNSIIIIKNI